MVRVLGGGGHFPVRPKSLNFNSDGVPITPRDFCMCTYHYHSFKPMENALIIITVPETACYHYHSSKKLSTGGGVAINEIILIMLLTGWLGWWTNSDKDGRPYISRGQELSSGRGMHCVCPGFY